MPTAFRITYPQDGDVLNRHDGTETAERLSIKVQGTAPSGSRVTVNGIEATMSEDRFACDVELDSRRNGIVAQAGRARQEIMVWWNRGSRKRFRFSSDDNILFLKDLADDPAAHPSLFDHWYLGFWREMHEEFGAKVHLNIYYQTQGFDLTQMPEIWRDEWEANADWLHLSFHALQDKPDRPYRNAKYPQIAHDYDLVCGHIRRFAGAKVISNTTTVHWAECPKDAVVALRDRGIERLIGIFDSSGGACTTGYYLPLERCAYCHTRNAWCDRETRLMFIDCAAVVNALDLKDIEPHLDARAASPHTADMMELLIHEQYFRRDLPQFYQPNVMDKVRAALKWVTKNGYEPVFWSEGFLGTPE